MLALITNCVYLCSFWGQDPQRLSAQTIVIIPWQLKAVLPQLMHMWYALLWLLYSLRSCSLSIEHTEKAQPFCSPAH